MRRRSFFNRNGDFGQRSHLLTHQVAEFAEQRRGGIAPVQRRAPASRNSRPNEARSSHSVVK
jgi:hypothetical protein